MNEKKLNERIKEWLLYAGFAAAVISVLAYMVMTVVMIVGFESNLEAQNQILFAVLGACVGLVITFSLRGQGISFAKREEESQTVMKEYHAALNKRKKEKELKDITHYVVWATIRDIFIKGITVGVSTYYVLYIFMQGNGDWSLIGLAFSNLLMFSGFGLVALSKTYDKYIEEHIPVIRERTKKIIADQDKKKKSPRELAHECAVEVPFAELPKDYDTLQDDLGIISIEKIPFSDMPKKYDTFTHTVELTDEGAQNLINVLEEEK